MGRRKGTRILIVLRLTPLQNTAIKKIPQAIFNKPGYYTLALPLEHQERLEVFSHHPVENAFFRMSRLVLKSRFADAEPPPRD
jgi:hypothetical protein